MRPSIPLRLAVAGILPLLAACGGDARAAGPVVRDSAGVRIVENTRPAWAEGQGWRVAPEPEVDIGVADGDAAYQFGRVAGALRLADGRVVVADGQANHLRYFDAGGRHLRTVGRTGGGPGEFQGLIRLLRFAGDTVAAWDYQLARLSLFAPDGTFLRGRSVPAVGGREMPQVEGAFADGSLLVTPFSLVFGSGTSVKRDTVTLLRYAADSARVDSIGRFPGAQTLSVAWTENGGGATRGPVPFGPNTYRVVRGDLLHVADSERFEVASYKGDGTLRRLVRAAYTPEALTPEEIARYKEEQRAESGESRERQFVERSLAATPFPKTKSAFAGMVVDATGATWLRGHSVGSDAPGRWTVFAADGALLGTVELPAGLHVVEIGADYVLGTWQDELDVEHVRLHRLERTRGRS